MNGSTWKKVSDYSNHTKFIFKDLSQDIILFSTRLKTTVKTIKAWEIIHKAERILLRECLKIINNVTGLSAPKRDMCKEGLVSDVINNKDIFIEYKELIHTMKEDRYRNIVEQQRTKFE